MKTKDFASHILFKYKNTVFKPSNLFFFSRAHYYYFYAIIIVYITKIWNSIAFAIYKIFYLNWNNKQNSKKNWKFNFYICWNLFGFSFLIFVSQSISRCNFVKIISFSRKTPIWDVLTLNLTLAKAICNSSSANLLPIQDLAPKPNGTLTNGFTFL